MDVLFKISLVANTVACVVLVGVSFYRLYFERQCEKKEIERILSARKFRLEAEAKEMEKVDGAGECRDDSADEGRPNDD